MIGLKLTEPGKRLSVLFLGAHSDDIEIGIGATILGWIEAGVKLDACWAVLSGSDERAEEARGSAAQFMQGAESWSFERGNFRDSYFPYQGAEIKGWLEGLRGRFTPDVVFTHFRHDAHQDHNKISLLTTRVFRDHLILEYEIPKWDGDLGQPNLYIPVTAHNLDRKIALLEEHFASQRSKDWFDAETFRGLARIRGMECRAPERYAEAFFCRKFTML
ncbi:MAG: PIG-L deacetylase family protein [Hyphomicrobiaceae bacterium]